MHTDYQRIALAIRLISHQVEQQPTLEQLATALGLSAYHFHRLFRRWAGITPKHFLQYQTVAYAKRLLANSHSLLQTSHEIGLSGPGRLHDHFVTLEAVTPGDYKQQGTGLVIRYGVHPSPFGPIFLAVTERGICTLAFIGEGDDGAEALAGLHRRWQKARIVMDPSATAIFAERVFACGQRDKPLPLLVRGSNFQVQVWKALLRIPAGQLCSYGQIARAIGKPSASRAVGRALGANPIGYLIPCHRVIREVGQPGGYRWGETRKRALIAWEAGRFGIDAED